MPAVPAVWLGLSLNTTQARDITRPSTKPKVCKDDRTKTECLLSASRPCRTAIKCLEPPLRVPVWMAAAVVVGRGEKKRVDPLPLRSCYRRSMQKRLHSSAVWSCGSLDPSAILRFYSFLLYIYIPNHLVVAFTLGLKAKIPCIYLFHPWRSH